MADRVVLDDVALTADGPTLALRLAAGQSLAVVGRANSGKSRFLSVLSQTEPPARGKVILSGPIYRAPGAELGRRAKPQVLATSSGPGANERAAHALSAVGLWNAKSEPIADLSPGQREAAMLLPALVANSDIIVIDGLLDRLDPWTLRDVLALLRRRMREGRTVCVATNIPRLAAEMDVLVVLSDHQVKFAGRPSDLVRSAKVSRVEVHSISHPAVRALAGPFEVTITEEEGVTTLEAAEGQQLAARMLLEGYGDVKFVLLSQPTVESALLAML
ncbi:MAG: ATP-binding cassette domain-containing protein [Fimbriimonadaceae bacterium]